MKRRQATVVFNDISGYTSLMQRNEEHAIQIRQRHKEVVDRLTRPDFLPAYESKGWILFTSGKQREGIESFEYYKNHSALPLAGLAGLSYAYARTLQAKEAKEVKELLVSVAQDMPSHLIHLDLAVAHLGAQEYPAMFEQLHKALDAKMPKMIFLETDPIWDEVRRFREYREIKDKVFSNQYSVISDQ